VMVTEPRVAGPLVEPPGEVAGRCGTEAGVVTPVTDETVAGVGAPGRAESAVGVGRESPTGQRRRGQDDGAQRQARRE
jgi:hypothetical protein